MSQKRRFHLTPRRRFAGIVVAASVGLLGAVGVVRAFSDDKVVVATGDIEIPEVRGMRAEEAAQTLRDARLVVVQTRSIESAEIPKGAAVGTEPPAGTKVAEDASVTLLVSLGARDVGTVNVPDV